MRDRMKTIDYRGGVLRFRIPADWLEEYEPEGGGTFYRDAPDAGTLRLSILTFRGPAMPAATDLLDSLRKSGEPKLLPNGNAMVSYVADTEESGEALRLFYWELANAVAPNHLRIAVFSHTVLARDAATASVLAEEKMLDEEIRSAVFAPFLGS